MHYHPVLHSDRGEMLFASAHRTSKLALAAARRERHEHGLVKTHAVDYRPCKCEQGEAETPRRSSEGGYTRMRHALGVLPLVASVVASGATLLVAPIWIDRLITETEEPS